MVTTIQPVKCTAKSHQQGYQYITQKAVALQWLQVLQAWSSNSGRRRVKQRGQPPLPKQLTEPKLATFNTHMPTEKKYCKLHTAQLHSGNTIQVHNRIILSTVCSSSYKQPSLPLELVVNSQREGYLVAARWFKGEANGKMTAV